MRYKTMLLALCAIVFTPPTLHAQKPAAGSAAPQHWVGAWACATQPIFKTDTNTYVEFHDQTIRTFVHPTIGEQTLRVRLSGSASYRAAPIDAATIGVRGQGNSIVAGSLRKLTFNGRSGINVTGGSTIWSDPISLPFQAMQDLVISLHITDFSDTETGHARAVATNLILAGDQTTAESVPATPAPKSVGSNYFLQGVDVLADEHTYAIVAFGDSITDGIQSTWNANHRWPDIFAERLATAYGSITTAHLAVLNEGISGNRLLHEYTGPSALARIDRDVFEVPGVRFVLLLEGINDINQNGANPKGNLNQIASAEEVIGAYRQMADRLHAVGIKLILGTLTPEKGIVQYTAQIEKDRATVNAWIRTSKSVDGVVDFDAALRDPADPTRLLAAYDSGDHIHPSDAGYKTMAEAIDIRSFIAAYLPAELAAGAKKK